MQLVDDARQTLEHERQPVQDERQLKKLKKITSRNN